MQGRNPLSGVHKLSGRVIVPGFVGAASNKWLDRMIKYGAPIPPEDKRQLVAYLLRHFRDPDGR